MYISPINFLWAAGADIFNGDWTPGWTSEQALKATEDYIALHTTHGVTNPNSLAFVEQDARQSFMQGKSAMIPVWWWAYSGFHNADTSTLTKDQVAFAGMPSYKGVTKTYAISMPFSISEYSDNKGAAWEFLKWLSNPEMDKANAIVRNVAGKSIVNNVVTHISSLRDADVNAANDGIQAAAWESLKESDIMPQIPEWPEVGDILSAAIAKAAAGGDTRQLMRDAAEQVELTEFLHRKPKALSGGQRQRVALARAIVRTPKFFLMDEPLSNLDAKLRVTMRAELKHLNRELKITTIYVTHDQIEAMTLADRVAVMKNGIIQQLGTPDEIYNDPANLFVAGFIGSPAMNLINGSVQDGHFVTTGGTKLVRVPTPDRASVVLGVRADDMRVSDEGQGDIDVRIYAFENTGEATLLTVQWGAQRVIAKGDRHLRKDQGDMVSISLDPNHLYLFDPESGSRMKS